MIAVVSTELHLYHRIYVQQLQLHSKSFTYMRSSTVTTLLISKHLRIPVDSSVLSRGQLREAVTRGLDVKSHVALSIRCMNMQCLRRVV